MLPSVSVLPRSADLRTPARRKVAAGLSGCIPLRTMPALDGIPVPPHARRCQSSTRSLAPRVPDDRQGLRRYPCVYQINKFCFMLFLLLMDERTVFDRMFSLGVRGSGTDTAPLGARVAAVAGMASATLPRRHFLYCSLRPENPVPPRGQRHHHRHHRDTMS